MFTGLLLGLFAAYLSYRSFLYSQSAVIRVSFVAMLALIGILFGRIVAFRLAARKLAALTAILYTQCDPQAFIEVFEPILRKTPTDNIAYFDGEVKLSFAYEALGNFDRALEILVSANPSLLKMHSLHARAMTANQRLRVCLLQADVEGSEEALEALSGIEEEAASRARMLASQLHACTELARIWLSFLKGEDVDSDYVRDEAELSKNSIYRAEMELLCGDILNKKGKAEEAKEHYTNARDFVPGLWAGRQAAKRLEG